MHVYCACWALLCCVPVVCIQYTHRMISGAGTKITFDTFFVGLVLFSLVFSSLQCVLSLLSVLYSVLFLYDSLF